jgi:drug/metabolite transporter (DMT)-like permease
LGGLTPRTEARRGHLAMLVFSALIAGSFSLGGRIAGTIDPAVLNVVRFLLAGLVTGAAALATGALTRATSQAPWRYLFLGALYALYFVTMFAALRVAPPVSIAAVFTLTPVMAAVAGWLILRQRTGPATALALAVGAAGALWVIFRADLGALLRFDVGPGEVLFFWGCVAHAVYPAVNRRLSRGEPALATTTAMLAAGFLILAAWSGRQVLQTDWTALPLRVWLTLGYLSLFSGAVTFVLIQYATLRLPGAKVMAYSYLVPSWVLVWELAQGAAPPPLPVLAGVTLSAGALVVLLRPD